MPAIDSLASRRVLNSHAEFTTEFELRLDDGRVGLGASSEGETISIYEDNSTADPGAVIERIRADGLFGRPIDQAGFDGYLAGKMNEFGRNMCYALSLALHEAAAVTPRQAVCGPAPRLCCNILNGGWHAYTNPVLSDFTEYLLVATSHDIEDSLVKHNEIQSAVRAALMGLSREIVSGNPVFRFAARDNRACIEFLLDIQDRLGFAPDFDLMIDASGGDLWDGTAYRLSLTDGSARTREEFREYWLDIIGQYPLRFLEDPFAESDTESWAHVASAQKACRLIGDNLYSTNAERIERGAAEGWTHGIIAKPNQAGTVTAVVEALETAKRAGQIVIASHRSISTESTYVATMACEHGAEYIKVGPLLTDYSAVMRVNEILRSTVCGT